MGQHAGLQSTAIAAMSIATPLLIAAVILTAQSAAAALSTGEGVALFVQASCSAALQYTRCCVLLLSCHLMASIKIASAVAPA